MKSNVDLNSNSIFTEPIIIPINGINMSFTSDVTIALKALPIITPTAKSSTLPLEIKVLNSLKNFFILSPSTNLKIHFVYHLILLLFQLQI